MMENESDDCQVRAELRKNFLDILKGFERQESTQIKLVNGEDLTNAKVLAFDREILQTIVAPLQTKTQALDSGILRLTDVQSITISLNPKEEEEND